MRKFINKLKEVTSNKNESNELQKEVKTISIKGLRKDLMNKLSIPKDTIKCYFY